MYPASFHMANLIAPVVTWGLLFNGYLLLREVEFSSLLPPVGTLILALATLATWGRSKDQIVPNDGGGGISYWKLVAGPLVTSLWLTIPLLVIALASKPADSLDEWVSNLLFLFTPSLSTLWYWWIWSLVAPTHSLSPTCSRIASIKAGK